MIKSNYEGFKTQMRDASYLVSEEFVLLNSFLSIQEMEQIKGVSALLLDGPPGAGKTFLAQTMAKVLNARLLKYQFTAGTGVEDILYDLNIPVVIKQMAGKTAKTTPSESVYLDGVLPAAIKLSEKETVILLFDEMDKASPKIDAFLLDFLENGDLFNPHLGELKANSPNLLVVITKNNERMLSEPLMRRCRRLYLDFPTAAIEEEIILNALPTSSPIIAKSLVGFANKIRKMRGTTKEPLKVPSTPELIRCARDILSLPSDIPKKLVGQLIRQWLIAYIDDSAVLSESSDELGGMFKGYLK